MTWEAIAIAVTLVLAWSGLLIGAVKWLLDRYHKNLDDRFEGLEESRAEDSKQYHKLERDFLLFRAELPLQYVRREDAIREQVVISSKLDALNAKIETLNVRMAHANRS